MTLPTEILSLLFMRKRTVLFLALLSALMLGAATYGFIVLFRTPSNPIVHNNTYRAVPMDVVMIQHFGRFETLAAGTAAGRLFIQCFYAGKGNECFLPAWPRFFLIVIR